MRVYQLETFRGPVSSGPTRSAGTVLPSHCLFNRSRSEAEWQRAVLFPLLQSTL